SPISRRATESAAPLFLEANGTLTACPGRHPPRYRQVVPSCADRQRTPAERLTLADLERFQAAPLPEIALFAESLVGRLARQGAYGLDETDAELVGEAVQEDPSAIPANAERVALAVTHYLAASGEYSYTLDRPRHDSTIDPTLDFLQNTRAGH